MASWKNVTLCTLPAADGTEMLHTDWFIFVMEAFGLLCGIWLTLSLYPLASLKVTGMQAACTTDVQT